MAERAVWSAAIVEVDPAPERTRALREPADRRADLPRDGVWDVLSVMHTCGMYDAAGQWLYDVGVPAKSGVRVCGEVSQRLGLHAFATESEDAILGQEPSRRFAP